MKLLFLLPKELHQHLYADDAPFLSGFDKELEGLEELLAQPLGADLLQRLPHPFLEEDQAVEDQGHQVDVVLGRLPKVGRQVLHLKGLLADPKELVLNVSPPWIKSRAGPAMGHDGCLELLFLKLKASQVTLDTLILDHFFAGIYSRVYSQ